MWSAIGMVLVLSAALYLRFYRLDTPLMWCDEAESSINALTILQHGVPVDTYLGMPIYENTLTEPWPESKEYEFRDSSYSKKGLAIYHGWLPLYSIATSFRFFGVEPDTDATRLTPKHDYEAISRRSMAGRVPGAVFGMFMVVILYLAGKEFFGADAGWAAMITAAIAIPMVNIARQARYYSLTATLSAACCLIAWRMYTRGRWRDFIIAGFLFAMLFHTHLLTFAIACVATACLVPGMFKHEKSIRKMLVCGGIILAAALPWIWYTGFLHAAQSMPRAIQSMKLPDDLLAWPEKYWPIATLLVVGMIWVVLTHLRPAWMPKRLVEPFNNARPAFYFLAAWILISFFMFMFLIPAASLFFQRLYLGAVGPGIIFGAMLFAGVGRAIPRRAAVPIAAVAFVAFVWFNTPKGYWWERNKGSLHRMAFLIQDMRQWNLKPDTRVYSTPNDHLTVTFYTGMPVQSIAPIRKSFLDSYPGEIVLLQMFVPIWPMTEGDVRDVATRQGTDLSESEVRFWTSKVNQTGAARKIRNRVQRTIPADEPLPDFAEALLDHQRSYDQIWQRREKFNFINPSIFRGYDLGDQFAMWQLFFYRFVNPLERLGDRANYVQRLSQGEVRILPTLTTIYTSPGPVRPANERLAGGN